MVFYLNYYSFIHPLNAEDHLMNRFINIFLVFPSFLCPFGRGGGTGEVGLGQVVLVGWEGGSCQTDAKMHVSEYTITILLHFMVVFFLYRCTCTFRATSVRGIIFSKLNLH